MLALKILTIKSFKTLYLFNVQRIYAFFVSYSMYKLVFDVFILLWWFPNGGVVELVITGGGFFLCHIFCSGGVSLWKFCCWWSWIGWVVALCVGAILVFSDSVFFFLFFPLWSCFGLSSCNFLWYRGSFLVERSV